MGWGNITILLFTLITLFVGWFLAWRRPRNALGWMVLAIPATFAHGSLPSRRWRWFFWYTVAATVATTVVGSTGATEVGFGVANPAHVAWGNSEGLMTFVIFGLGLPPAFVGSVASLSVRYHRAGTLERTQLRWVFWGVALAVGLFLLSSIPTFVIPQEGPYGWINTGAQDVAGLGYSLIPVAILIAVMHVGLYGIDRFISRTVSYEAFGRRLRDGADPHTTAANLIAALGQTFQPATLGVWTRR